MAVSVRTDTMQLTVEEMLEKLRRQRTVVEVRQGVGPGPAHAGAPAQNITGKGPWQMAKIAILGFWHGGQRRFEVLRRNAAGIARRAGEPVEVKYILEVRDFSAHPMRRCS